MIIFSKTFTSPKSWNAGYFAFLLVYIMFLLFLCDKLVIQIDEAFTLNTINNRLSEVINLSYYFEGQPPFYFIILSIWSKLNNSIFFARLLSIIFILVSAFFINRILKLHFNSLQNNWVIVLFLLNPFTVWAAMEIRTYSLLVLLSTLTIYLFYLIYFYNKSKLKVWFVLFCLLGIYTQYYFVFLVISLSLLLIIYKDWRTFFNYYLLLVPVAILALPNLFFIVDQLEMHQNTQVSYSFSDRLKNILFVPEQFIFPIGQIPVGKFGRWVSRLLFAGLVLTTFYFLFKSKSNSENHCNESTRINEILIVTSLLLIIFLFLFSFTNLIFHIKYLTIVFPFFCIFCSGFSIHRFALKNTSYILLAILYLSVLVNTYKPPFIKTSNPLLMAQVVENIQEKDEPILFHDKSLILLFKPYYEGKNPLIPLPNLIFDFNYFSSYIQDTTELETYIDKALKNSKSFILINGTDLGFVAKNPMSNKIIDIYLKNNYLIPNDTLIQGINSYDFLRARRLIKNI